MKKWSVLSVPAIGLAGLGIWAQSLAAAPTNQPTGVVVVDPAVSSKVSGSSAPAPASTSSPSAPDRFRSAEAPRRFDMAQPQTTEQAETQDADDDGPVVQHVEPTQVTSPAAPPPGESASASPDDKDGPGNNDGPSDSGPDDSGPDDSAGLAGSGGGSDD